MHVMFVAQGLHGGGAEVVVRRWAEQLIASGHNVDVVSTTESVADVRLDPRIARFRMRRAGILRRAGGLRRLIRDRAPDVVMAHLTRQNVLVLTAVLGLRGRVRPRVAIEEHSVLSVMAAGSLAGLGGRLLARMLYPRADLVFAVSHAVGADLLRYGVPRSRLRIVPNPLLETGLAATGPSSTQRRPPHVTLVLPIRLVPVKQPLHAIRAARELMDRGVDVHLKFFGVGPLEEQLRAEAESQAIPCEFRGWVEDWPASCAETDIVLLSSAVEGRPNVLIEAAAAGLRSVAPSTALGVADALVPGLTGELALTDRPSDIADAVERAAQLAVPVESVGPWLRQFETPASTQALLAALRLD